jgi:hypothetical protein
MRRDAPVVGGKSRYTTSITVPRSAGERVTSTELATAVSRSPKLGVLGQASIRECTSRDAPDAIHGSSRCPRYLQELGKSAATAWLAVTAT